MNIVIVGCGRCGSRLGRRLAESGNRISIIDVDRAAFNRLGPNFRGSTYQGSGLDHDVLVRAGTERAEIVFALTGGDNRNLMIAQMVKIQFSIDRAIARLHDPIRAKKFYEMGVETLCTTTIITGLLESYTVDGKFPDFSKDLAIYGDSSGLQDTKELEVE